MAESVKSILFVELIGGLADFLIALPAIHALAKSHPDARLSVLTYAPNAKLLEKDPFVSRVFVAPCLSEKREYQLQTDFLRDLLALEYFDAIACDTAHGGIARLVDSSKARLKTSDLWRGSLDSDLLIEERFLSVLIDDGLVDSVYRGLSAKIVLSDDEEQWSSVWLRNNMSMFVGKRIAVLHPEVNKSLLRWPAERFIELGKWLVERRDLSVVLSSGDDTRLAKEIALGIGGNAIVLPKTDLRRFAALVSRASIFVSPNLDMAHLAAASGAPTVALFGPITSERYGLRKPNVNLHSPMLCSQQKHLDFTQQGCWYSEVCVFSDVHSCMEGISVDLVVDAVQAMLQDC